MNFPNLPESRVLIFGDSNTFGYDPADDGRYAADERYPTVLQTLLGEDWHIIEEGLPGRTAVFEDPISEGLNGLTYITPCLLSHVPIDTLVIMLGTNDSKERFACDAELMAKGIIRLAQKAAHTPCWRDQPDILLICPPVIRPAYRDLKFAREMGRDCDVKTAELAGFLGTLATANGFRFLDAEHIPGVEMHPLDGMHLTGPAHIALAGALAKNASGALKAFGRPDCDSRRGGRLSGPVALISV